MNVVVQRTCTEIPSRDADQKREQEPRPLEAFRSVPAYVLLGDPGSGKTTAFEAECKALGENAYITARDFLALDVNSHPEWRDKTLFIDGLDEIRAGAPDARTPFDQIRRHLDTLGWPRFRISCREADWLGDNDRRHLASVSKNSQVTVLRLNPLRDSDVAEILNTRPDIADADAFITVAREQGVDGLLTNPQTLKMLADVVGGGGGWPESRKETFKMACLQTVREHNEEHVVAGQPSAPDRLLNAAGRLCAAQLISGAAGYTLSPGQPNKEYPALEQCDSDRPEMLRPALSTNLFKGESNNRFSPVHRHIAEFLGARHLAQLVDNGLPARRVLGLITGRDGFVVTEMRGLSAWFAAHCKDARPDLIKCDPIGVGLYGDVHGFASDEKRALLESLRRGTSRLDSVWRTAAAFGALATPDMESVLREILNDSNRSRDHQMFTDFVLRVLSQGTPLPDLSGMLLEIVRDATRWPRINNSALDAFIHCHTGQDKTSQLKVLLADIQSGGVSGPDNELLGTVLTQLYPQHLPPSEVWDYLSVKGNPELIGMYCRFWDTGLIEKSSDEQVAELLDNLQQRLSGLRPALESRMLERLPLRLLVRGLIAHGDAIETERLYDWLGVGFPEIQDGVWNSKEAIDDIRAWLAQHPEIQKAVIVEGLAQCPESDEFRYHAFNVQKRLYGADPPPDFGLWCLNQAVAVVNTNPRVAEHLLELAVRSDQKRSGSEGLSLELIKEQAGTSETLKASLDRLLAPPSIPPEHLEEKRKGREHTEERRREEEQWLDDVRANETDLRENRAAPALLHQLAKIYLDGLFRSMRLNPLQQEMRRQAAETDDGRAAIEKRLRGDLGLVEATLLGLRGVVDRQDVPEVKKILGLIQKDRSHYLGLPFLAGLAEIERTAPEDSSEWKDERIRKAIAFYYSTLHEEYRPKWYRRLLAARPEIVADVQVQFAVSEFRSDHAGIYKLRELAHDPDYAQVARHASLPLLSAFPTRCKHINALDHLLWAALQHADRAMLQEVIGKKLSRKSMNVVQRVHWLAAGLVVSPAIYCEQLSDFVQGREKQVQQVATFFCDPKWESRYELGIPVRLEIPVIELLIRLVGSYAGPDQWEDGLIRLPMNSSLQVHAYIQHLAASPTKDASAALAALRSDPALARWHTVLTRAQDSQLVIRRDAGYQHPDIEQVCRTLNDREPANAADLAALVMDRLRELAVQIRTSNTDDWRQYWNEDSHGRPCSPKPENSCRDALLSDLQQRLPQAVDAQPEGQYANDKRADIRVSCRDFQVPVEIKRNKHQDLWRACKDQLIKQYTSDPATNGYGIYLVFWFGKDPTQLPPSGTRPDSPQELEERLKVTLSEDEARKISVCVIDVSNPRE